MRRFTVFCTVLLLSSFLLLPVSAQTSEYDGYLVKLSDEAPRLFSKGDLEDFIVVDTLEEALELPEEYVEYIEPNYWIYLFEPAMDGEMPALAFLDGDAPPPGGSDTGAPTPGAPESDEPAPVPPEEDPPVPEWPNDPLYKDGQWSLQAINGLAACEAELTGGSVLVGMVDSGVHAFHEDINASNISGENYVKDNRLFSDDIYGHGTVVAGVIAAQTNNGVGVAGILPDVQLRAYRCFNSKTAKVSEVLPGILKAIEDGCQVINLSLGTRSDIKAIRETVEKAIAAGAVVVAAVGNEGTDTLQYPAAYPGVIGVGAVDTNLNVSSFSQRNQSVFVTAPGETLIGLDYEKADGYTEGLRGTSYAAPFVSAMVAAALDYDADITYDGICYLLKTTSLDQGASGYDTSYGWGVVNLENFLAELKREFTITYELNGGSLPADAREGYVVTDDALVLPKAKREGYLLTGWYADEALEQPIKEIPAGSVGDKTFYAGWVSHTHDWSDWEMLSLPTADALGVEQRSCYCGETDSREVEGVWQKFALAEYLQELPDALCAGMNLWGVLEHHEEYFANGVNWGVHSSGNVYSVTIPVEAGEKIAATSFGAYPANGNTVSTGNGIRVTFFDTYGVCKTLTTKQTYAEYTANGGYLVAPEGAIAVNVPMWSNSEGNELFLLNRAHDWSAWSSVSENQHDRNCGVEGCGLTEAENHQFTYTVEDGELMCSCSTCAHTDAGVKASVNGQTVVVDLGMRCEGLKVMSACYRADGSMQEAYLSETIDTKATFVFKTDFKDCSIKVFFLNAEYKPWLRALPVEKAY